MLSVGVWHSAQPTALEVNNVRPAVMDAAETAPNELTGAGGARKRIKLTKFTTPLLVSCDPSVVRSSGVPLNWHAAVSSRSWGNDSLVTPCSTLYASAAKIMRDLFWAFQPKRVMVPSLPFRFSWPEIPSACLAVGIGALVLEQRDVGNGLDEARAEHGCRNAEDRVAAGYGAREIGLRQDTTGRIRAAGNGEKSVHASVAAAVGIEFEADLAHRPVRGDERRDRVRRALLRRDGDLRVDGGAGTPDGRLGMAAAAVIEIEARAQSLFGAGDRPGHRRDLVEIAQAGGKRFCVLRAQPRHGAARPGGSSAHAGIGLGVGRKRGQ